MKVCIVQGVGVVGGVSRIISHAIISHQTRQKNDMNNSESLANACVRSIRVCSISASIPKAKALN